MPTKIKVNPVYLKLGEQAQTFHCPVTQVNINNKQVIKIDRVHLQKPSLAAALKKGHIVLTTEEEWQAYKEEAARLQKESRKFAPKRKKVVEVDEEYDEYNSEKDEEDDDNEGGGDDDDDEEDDDDNEDLTKSEMIDYLKESPLIEDAQKKKLTKLSDKELKTLYNQVKTPQ